MMPCSDTGLPNLIMPGAQKSGTTFLAELLGQHPDIYLPPVKEPAHFVHLHEKPLVKRNGEPKKFAFTDRNTYRQLYADAGPARYRLDASTDYFSLPDLPARLQDLCRGAKIICVLRHPVDRAFSAYSYHRQLEDTEAADFDAALAEEREVLSRGSVTISQPLMGTGEYSGHLARWQESFGADNVHVVLFEDLRDNPAAVCERIFGFLGIEPFQIDATAEKNSSHLPLLGWRKFALKASRSEYRALAPLNFILRLVFNPVMRHRIRLVFKRRLPKAGTNPVPRLSPDDRRRHTIAFDEEIDRLAKHIGRNLDHWKAR